MRVLIACGGTAGHIYPGIALSEELCKDKGCQAALVVSAHPRDKNYLQMAQLAQNLRVFTVCTRALPYRFSLRSFVFLFSLICGCAQSLYILWLFRPDAMVGFGGYASFAPLIAAKVVGTPTLIHEQNLVPGQANRLLARWVDKIAVTFEDTISYLAQRRLRHKIIKTGLPLRKTFFENKEELSKEPDFDAGKCAVLVLGGSQGAHNINELMLKCLKMMDKESRANLQLLHLTGRADCANLRDKYSQMGIDVHIRDFMQDMARAYRGADLLVARAGASTIFEAATFALPCILIPHSGGTDHQRSNAQFFQDRGAALVLDERNASADDLKKTILKLVNNKGLREDLSQKIRLFANPQAAYNLKEQVYALCKKN